MSDVFDAVSELLDKQLFSDSKSDILTNVFTHALAARQNLTKKMTTHSVPVHLSKGTKNQGKIRCIKIAVTL